MDDDEIKAFADAWLRDNAALLDEMVALVGDDPRTPYGAAIETTMSSMPNWKPNMA